MQFTKPATYQIVVEGLVDPILSDRLCGMSVTPGRREDESMITVLAGRLSDQAELSGVLNTLYDLHFSIVSVGVVD